MFLNAVIESLSVEEVGRKQLGIMGRNSSLTQQTCCVELLV